MFKEFQMTEDEWNNIKSLSTVARNTPVIALSSADAMAGRDLSSMAHEDVYSYWRDLGMKYGFDAGDVRPVDEANRTISARLTKSPPRGSAAPGS